MQYHDDQVTRHRQRRRRHERQHRPWAAITHVVCLCTCVTVSRIVGLEAYNTDDGLFRSRYHHRKILQRPQRQRQQLQLQSREVDRRAVLNDWMKKLAIVTVGSSSSIGCTASLSLREPAFARNLPKSNGANLSKTGTVQSLVPIVDVKYILQSLLDDSLRPSNNKRYLTCPTQSSSSSSYTSYLLFGIPTQEDDFKRLFDEYSVPVSYKQRYLDSNAFLVYYSRGFDGVGRPSLEAGGEVGKYDDAVNQIQTVQYGSRNDVWVAWEAFQAEYSFFCSSFSSSSAAASMSVDEIENSTTEMIKYLKEALKAMNTYLELAPEEQLREALSRVAVLHDTSR